MSEELDVLKMVVQRLDSAGLPYMVTGSIATNFYARPRMTRDIDIVIDLNPSGADRIGELFEGDFYVDREEVRRAVSQRSVFNIIHNEFIIKVDFVIKKEAEYRQLEFQRRKRITIEDVPVAIVTPEDLILSKLKWAQESHSEVQLGDVRNLIESVDTLDKPYLEEWVRKLGLGDLYREALS